MQIDLRLAFTHDFDYCASLYFAGMDTIIRELKLNRVAQAMVFKQQWDSTQVRIITCDGVDIGWLQSTTRDDAVFLAQLFVDSSFQRRGIGTEVMKRLIAEASRAHLAVTLGVVKINPAVRFYERLGFRITHHDDRKFYMTRDPDAQNNNFDLSH
jgi:GNAT superfamily N-acetyltransferase